MEKSQFSTYLSKIGYILIEHANGRLIQLKILRGEPTSFGMPSSFSQMVFSQVEEYLHGKRRAFSIDVDLSGHTEFQRLVWRELQRVPYGQVCSYADIARAILHPRAARAVGAACNRNPIHIINPCHRVVGSHGELTGYAAGVNIKRELLELESMVSLHEP